MPTSHSYLGNGLYAARLATLGALGADGRVSSSFCYLPVNSLSFIGKLWQTFSCFHFASGLDWKIFTSSCLPKKFREDVTFGGTTYKVSGIPDGEIKVPWGFHFLPSDVCFPLSSLEHNRIQNNTCNKRTFM